MNFSSYYPEYIYRKKTGGEQIMKFADIVFNLSKSKSDISIEEITKGTSKNNSCLVAQLSKRGATVKITQKY